MWIERERVEINGSIVDFETFVRVEGHSFRGYLVSVTRIGRREMAELEYSVVGPEKRCWERHPRSDRLTVAEVRQLLRLVMEIATRCCDLLGIDWVEFWPLDDGLEKANLAFMKHEGVQWRKPEPDHPGLTSYQMKVG